MERSLRAEKIGKRVAVIADRDPVSNALLVAALRAEGFQVYVTADGSEALARILALRPSVVLLAQQLTGMGGFELCQRLKRRMRTRRIPILFLVDRMDVDAQDQALRIGASDFICKPIRQPEVVARIRAQTVSAPPIRGQERPSTAPDLQPSAQDTRQESNEWLTFAMQTGHMYAFEWTAATDQVERSHGAIQILGSSSAIHDTGENWLRRIHADDLERVRKVRSILGPAYDTYHIQYRVVGSGGEIVHLRESARAFFDSHAQLTRVIGMCVDVTDYERSRTSMERHHAALLELFQKLPVAAAFQDRQGNIIRVNKRFEKVFGDEFGEASRPQAWLDTSRLPGEFAGPREWQVMRRDGRTRTVNVVTASVAEENLILLDDVTELRRAEEALRESEELFRSMADSAPVMIWVSGPDKLCTFFNQGWLRFTGRTLEQELGDGWAEGVHRDDLKRCIAIYTSSFDARRDFEMEYRLRRSDGEYRWILDRGTPRVTADGVFAGYVGSCIDITDMKNEQEQMLARQKLESLGVLAGGVAHDFNNLLGCILAYADVMTAEVAPDSPMLDGLQSIETLAMRASEIVGQIMAFTGEEQENLEPVLLSDLVSEILHLVRVCIPKRGALQVDVPADLPVLQANPTQIRQVVMNLILNAAEALGQQAGVITVRAQRVPPTGSIEAGSDAEHVRLEISDTGCGMSDYVRTRMFDPFFSTKSTGRGLGLAAVQGIVRSHGGTIEVFSGPGQGTTFQIDLPTAAGAAARRGPGTASALETPRLGKGFILVVEDEDMLRISVSKMLRKRGFSVLEAQDGNLAVEMIRARGHEIAVVLLDLTLPGKSSLEVLEEVRRSDTGTKVILTSAYGRERAAAAMGVNPEVFIRKPYHLNELVTIVRSALQEKPRVRRRHSGGA